MGFAANAFTLVAFPEINGTIAHLREVLGANAYETFAQAGARMTNATAAQFALDQIERERAS